VTPDTRPGISGLTPEAMAAWLVARDVPAYRARQVADGVWRRFEEQGQFASSFAELRCGGPANLPSADG